MKAIAIFGGTVEGRLLAEQLQQSELNVYISVATEYGASLLPKSDNIFVHIGRMEQNEMQDYLTKNKISYCIDATHPYATVVTENIYYACEQLQLPYIRIGRNSEQSERTGVVYVESIENAVTYLNETEGNIFITTGSKELEKYTLIKDYQTRCFARVLPMAHVIEQCNQLGFQGKHLIAMQGAFSEEMNRAMINQINASWLVTKQSGVQGGFEEKCESAIAENVGLIVIGRPKELVEHTMELSEVLAFLREQFHLQKPKREVAFIGIGMGNKAGMTIEVKEYLKQSDIVIGAKRIIDSCKCIANKADFLTCYKGEEIVAFLNSHENYQKIALVFSGDIGFYSGAEKVRHCFEKEEQYKLYYMSGISSPIYFMDKLGISWDDMKLASCHGKSCNIPQLVRCYKKVCVLLGKETDVSDIANLLLERNLEDVKMTVGENLSYQEETITTGYPNEFVGRIFSSLSVLLLENKKAENIRTFSGIKDEKFIRGKVPMTKEEVRVLVLSKLKLTSNSILYDIGAGTGSVSVEASLYCDEGTVYAIERKKEAIELLHKNKIAFGADSMKIVEGEAPDCLEGLEPPTHVFIGGSNGKLTEIINAVRSKNKTARFVITAITLETMTAVKEMIEQCFENKKVEIVQVNVARSKPLGSYTMLQAENPIFIIQFGEEEEKNE